VLQLPRAASEYGVVALVRVCASRIALPASPALVPPRVNDVCSAALSGAVACAVNLGDIVHGVCVCSDIRSVCRSYVEPCGLSGR